MSAYRISSAPGRSELEQQLSFALKKSDMIHIRKVVISTTPDVVYPWDSGIIKRVQAIEPRAIPVWIKRIYRTPAGTDVVFGFNGLYRYDWQEPVINWGLRGVEFEHCGLGPAPNYEWLILEEDAPGNGWPGAYVAVDGALLHRVRRIVYLNQFERERGEMAGVDYTSNVRAYRQSQLDAIQAEHDYRWDTDAAADKRAAQGVAWSDVQARAAEAPITRPSVILGH